MPNEKEEEEAPAITAFKDNYIGSLGGTTFLYCRASGQPKPTIEWLYNGRPVKRDRTDNKPEPLVFVEGEDLIVRSARPGVDTVSCLANNSAGTANKTAMLLVVGKNWTAGSDVLQ